MAINHAPCRWEPAVTRVHHSADEKSAHFGHMRVLRDILRLGAEGLPGQTFARHAVDLLFQSLRIDHIVLAIIEADELRPLAWQGLGDIDDPGPLAPLEVASQLAACSEDQAVAGVSWPWSLPENVEPSRIIPLRLRDNLVGALYLGRSASDSSAEKKGIPLDELDDDFLGALESSLAGSLDQARLQERLGAKETMLHTVIENIPEACLVFDSEGKVLLYNTRAAQIVGHDQWTELGTESHAFELADRHGRPIAREEWPLLKAVATGEGCKNAEYLLDFGEFKRHVLMNVIPIVDEEGAVTAFVATGHDVTTQREEDQRKDDFLSVASHELRGPLTPLSGLLQLLRKDVECGKLPALDLVHRAEEQTRRLRRLIDDLLDTSRIETGRLLVHAECTDLNEVLRRIMDPWFNGGHGHRFHLQFPSNPIYAMIDPDRIEQIVTNIVDNAVKHGKEGGRIEVELSAEGSWGVLTVTDEGDGIDEEHLAHVFDRLYHNDRLTRAGRKSMGLGLYISRELIHAHGGRIHIKSASGCPTVVRVELPLLD
ncbi:MAG: ATP-binding protein [Bradymonadaceae bacterium]